MTAPPIALDLRTLAVGDRVQHPLLVRERVERSTRSGSPYVVLRLGNPTGTIETAPVWQERLDWVAGAERGRVVQVIGDIAAYGDDQRRQLQLSAPVRPLPATDLPVTSFLERVDVPVDRLWDALDRLRTGLGDAALRAAVDACWGDDAFRVEAESQPMAATGPGGRLGALLLHTVEVATVARQLARSTRLADPERAVAGALLHDVGVMAAWRVGDDGIEPTPDGRLLGSGTLGLRILAERWAPLSLPPALRLDLEHVVLASAATDPLPARTPAAACVAWADRAVRALADGPVSGPPP
jgi:3'-5' exoribonuclease